MDTIYALALVLGVVLLLGVFALIKWRSGRAVSTIETFGETSAARAAPEASAAADDVEPVAVTAGANDNGAELRALTAKTEQSPDDADSWNQLGHLQVGAGDLAAAAKSYGKVLALGKTSEDQTLLAIAHGNLGLVYLKQGELPKAVSMLRKAYTINKTLGSREGMAEVDLLLGQVFAASGEAGKAGDHWRRAAKVFREIGAEAKAGEAEVLLRSAA